MEFLWVYVGGPLAGGFGASVFYELIYKKQIRRLWNIINIITI